MKQINKGAEPNSLTRHRVQQFADYDNYVHKGDLRASLVAEQRGICCYCMGPIQGKIGKMKIEHFNCQENYPQFQLDYWNMLGACMGNEGQPLNKQHCDTFKRMNDFSRNPADRTVSIENLIHYFGDGTISSSNGGLNRELDEVLNLNLSFLKNNRKAALDAFKTILSKRRGNLQRPTLERWLRDWNGESHQNELRPYCQVIVYWLRKRLNRA